MKKKVFVFVLGMVISMTIYAQTNVFPGSGKVGIGTTSPNASLSIYSDENWNSGWRNNLTLMSNDYPAIKFHSVNSNTLSLIGNDNDGGLYFGVNCTPNAFGRYGMVILPNGNMGVGTLTPRTNLDIGGNLYILNASIGRSGSHYSEFGYNVGFTGQNDVYNYLTEDYASSIRLGFYGSIEFRTAPIGTKGSNIALTERMRISQNGNVGIGTTNPLNGLHIYKNNDFGGGSIRFGHSGAADGVLSFGFNDATVRDALKLSYFPHNSNTGKVDLMTLDVNGNVGIGTLDPKNKLDVNGTIRAKEVKVETGWADFVFTPTYKLRPLSEVEQFIKTNGHLPEIPKAEDVQQNGVNLGEMQTKLLQKVEELTLYSIEQEKKLAQQDKENIELKEEIKKLKELIIEKLGPNNKSSNR